MAASAPTKSARGWGMLGCDGWSDAGGRKTDTRGIAGPPCSSANGGILPPTAGLLSLWVATAAQGCPRAAAVVGVRDGGGSGPRFSPCRCGGDPPAYAQSCGRGHTRSMHAGIRASHREDGVLLPYARARTLMSEFLPLADIPAVETNRRRTMRVGARLEQQAVACHPPRRRPKRKPSCSPSTAVTCARFAVIRFTGRQDGHVPTQAHAAQQPSTSRRSLVDRRERY
jgi:hypothetical protein